MIHMKVLFSSFFFLLIQIPAYPSENCEGNCTDGFGKLVTQNGAVYSGNFKKGKYHGKGTLLIVQKQARSTYSGDWVDGKRHGSGTQIFSSGGRYVGEWLADQMTGKGHFTSVLGECDLLRVYSHENGIVSMIHGAGLYADYCTYEGTWFGNEPSGYGDLITKFDPVRVASKDFYEKVKSFPFLSYLLRMQNYDRLPAHARLLGIWSKGLPKKVTVTVRDGKGTVFYEGELTDQDLNLPNR